MIVRFYIDTLPLEYLEVKMRISNISKIENASINISINSHI